jgi:signal transduction histidine kinase
MQMDQHADIPAEDIRKLKMEINQRLTGLNFTMNNLLNWSQGQLKGFKISPQVVDLNDIMAEHIALYDGMATEKSILLHSEVPANTLVWTDPDHLRLIVRNILHNALKYSDAHDKILIRSEEHPQSIVISFSDTGKGMDQDQVNAILQGGNITSQPGTAGEKGSGIGLGLAMDLLKRNQCHITVESALDQGTTFVIKLPKPMKEYFQNESVS